jgi:hypothetical protein
VAERLQDNRAWAIGAVGAGLANVLRTASARQRLTAQAIAVHLAALLIDVAREPAPPREMLALALHFGPSCCDATHREQALPWQVPIATQEAKLRMAAVAAGLRVFNACVPPGLHPALDQLTTLRNAAEVRLSTDEHVHEAPINCFSGVRRLHGSKSEVMDELIPRFIDPAFEQSPQLKSASAEEQDCAGALARDAMAVIDPRIPDVNGVAAGIIRRTARSLRYQGRLQDTWCRIPKVRAVATHAHVLQLLAFAYGRRSIPIQTLNFTLGHEPKLHF